MFDGFLHHLKGQLMPRHPAQRLEIVGKLVRISLIGLGLWAIVNTVAAVKCNIER